jgi:hypothetical protein
MIFEAHANQVSSLSSEQLVMLMKRLLLAECRKVNVPLRSATVPLQITIADGGEDGRAAWEGGVESTDFFPSRFSVFQAKAQNLNESSITAEIVNSKGKGLPKLNDAIAEVIRRNGAYIVFCSHAFTGQKIARLCKAVTSAIRSSGKPAPRRFKCDVYDANRIADWVNTHPSAALWLTELGRGRSVAGFQTQDSWARSPDIHRFKWISDEEPRFAPTAVVIEPPKRKDPSRNAWTFRQAADQIHTFLSGDGCALRIAGPSGFGKSRFAFELFNDRLHIADAVESAALFYADMRIVGDEAIKLALEIADGGSPTIMIVDECPDEQHTELVNCSRRAGSRLRVVTIDVETRIAPTANTLVLHLEPASSKTIAAIARAVAPSIGDTTARLIGEFSNGFPRMAVLAAPEGGSGKTAIRSAVEILNRVIWGRRPFDQVALRALEVASLFEWLGLDGGAGNEASLVAESLAQMPRDRFVEHVRSFTDRGVIVAKGNFIQIAPAPLAAALASRRFALLTEDRLDSFWAIAPERLKKSLLRRMKWLDGAEAARAFATRILSPSRLGNLAQFSTDFGADCIDRLVHVAPDTTMDAIDAVLGTLDAAGLKALGSGRRHLVWALEKLAFRNATFVRAATQLRRLAATETESGISNNATGQFQQLFQLYLSGTEAPPELRLLVLDEGLGSADVEERAVCVGSLDRMLTTHHFSRSGGAEEVGSQAPLEDWFPKSNAEIEAHLLAALARLKAIASGTTKDSGRAKTILASHVRSLISHIPLDEIRSMIVEFGRGQVWTEAIQGVNAWLFFDRSDGAGALGAKVRMLFSELLPTDPVELALLYSNSWSTDLHDPDDTYSRANGNDVDFEYGSKQLIRLAEEVAASSTLVTKTIQEFTCAETKASYPFAKRLAEKLQNAVKTFERALAFAEAKGAKRANLQFFSGLVSGIESRDPKGARKCIQKALRSHSLRDNAIALITSKRLRADDIKLVSSLVASKDVTPRQSVLLSYGRGMDHLRPEEITPLLDVLCDLGSEGMWAALEIVFMYLHGGKEPHAILGDRVRIALLSARLFKNPKGAADGHHFESLIRMLAGHKFLDKQTVRGLARQLVRLLRKENSEAHRAIGDSARAALLSLISVDGEQLWRELKGAAESDDWYVQHRLNDFVGAPHNDNFAAGPLFQLAPDLYLRWIRKLPEKRARWAMAWLPIALKDSTGTLRWHPALLDFVSEFHGSKGVLAELSSRLHPTSWWGPVGPHLQPGIDLLREWEAHGIPAVRAFAQAQTRRFTAEIEDGLRRDEEEIVRFS